jgi:hypothetical protein
VAGLPVLIQHRSNVGSQAGWGEGFLLERGARIEQAALNDVFTGIAGHEEHRQAGLDPSQVLAEFSSAHLGHHDIADNELDCSRVLLNVPEGLNPVPGLDDGVPVVSEAPGSQVPHDILVLDDQDGL